MKTLEKQSSGNEHENIEDIFKTVDIYNFEKSIKNFLSENISELTNQTNTNKQQKNLLLTINEKLEGKDSISQDFINDIAKDVVENISDINNSSEVEKLSYIKDTVKTLEEYLASHQDTGDITWKSWKELQFDSMNNILAQNQIFLLYQMKEIYGDIESQKIYNKSLEEYTKYLFAFTVAKS